MRFGPEPCQAAECRISNRPNRNTTRQRRTFCSERPQCQRSGRVVASDHHAKEPQALPAFRTLTCFLPDDGKSDPGHRGPRTAKHRFRFWKPVATQPVLTATPDPGFSVIAAPHRPPQCAKARRWRQRKAGYPNKIDDTPRRLCSAIPWAEPQPGRGRAMDLGLKGKKVIMNGGAHGALASHP